MTEDTLTIAYSPCPNDTFVFHAWVHGLVPDAPPVEVTYADIDVTNHLVHSGGLDVMKISYAALPDALEQYELLPCGGAVGRGCGPLLLTAPGGPPKVAGKTVAVPSLKSTAYLLSRHWAVATGQTFNIKLLPFRDIMPAVRDGAVDAGLVIHEARFTYRGFGLNCLVDLGDWWEGTTGSPVPLGAIVARRALGARRIAEITRAIRASVDHAFAHPADSWEYVLEHAQETDPDVARAHIALYVNEFTRDLGPEGLAAVDRLLGAPVAAGGGAG